MQFLLLIYWSDYSLFGEEWLSCVKLKMDNDIVHVSDNMMLKIKVTNQALSHNHSKQNGTS